jgi:hypothetical protein
MESPLYIIVTFEKPVAELFHASFPQLLLLHPFLI